MRRQSAQAVGNEGGGAGLPARGWRIRRAEGADRPAIEALAQAAYAVYLPRMDRKPFPMLDDYAAHIAAGRAYVLEKADGIRGTVVLTPGTDGDLWLDNLAVSPECRGRGYGRALVRFAGDVAARAGCHRIRLYTNEAMHENLTFYPHLGFAESHRALDRGYRRVFFVRELD